MGLYEYGSISPPIQEGCSALKFIHLNDSKTEIGSHVDGHEHIGLGKIGVEGLTTIINDKSLRDLATVMQTPADSIRDYSKELPLTKYCTILSTTTYY